MSLSAGTRLGSYEVLAPIGKGGMGEVWKARDTKLGRDVALKILPAAFASDPDRMARFEREARVLASLDHPNIAAIYGLEESNGVRALVLALIDGPTLADRIAAGPIPLDEAIQIARQIAESVEYGARARGHPPRPEKNRFRCVRKRAFDGAWQRTLVRNTRPENP